MAEMGLLRKWADHPMWRSPLFAEDMRIEIAVAEWTDCVGQPTMDPMAEGSGESAEQPVRMHLHLSGLEGALAPEAGRSGGEDNHNPEGQQVVFNR